MDRLRHLALLAALWSCNEPAAPAGPPPSRFAAVKNDDAERIAAKFCEKSFRSGDKKWRRPPDRPLPGAFKTEANPEGKAWTWVNLWASWCAPCIEEMPLLSRWKATLAKEGVPLRLELWSIDVEEDAFKGAMGRNYPGSVHWLKDEASLPGLLDTLALPADTAIPIHGLVDPAGDLRCVRVGAVGAENYGAIRTLVSQGL